MQATLLKRLCKFQFLALVFALPFEYYFSGRDQSLYTNLKFQVLLLLVTWTGLKLVELGADHAVTWRDLRETLPGRLALAIAAFVLTQLLAAMLAPAHRGNALRAASKAAFGALVALAAADLSSNRRIDVSGRVNSTRQLLWALSASGTCMAFLGLGSMAGNHLLTKAVSIFQAAEYTIGSWPRFASTMEYPNTAGCFLSVSLCATLALAGFDGVRLSRRRQTWVWPAMAGIQTLALTLTYSRGAQLATIIAIVSATWVLRHVALQAGRAKAAAAVLVVLIAGASIAVIVRQEEEGDGAFARRRISRFGLAAADDARLLLPDHHYPETIAVENASTIPWKRDDYGIAYRYHSLDDGRDIPAWKGVNFRRDVAPGQTVQLTVPLDSPPDAGEYLLIWFVYQGKDARRELKDSYSPGILCTVRCPGDKTAQKISNRARRDIEAIHEERRNLEMIAVPRRRELWAAAVGMFLSRPLLGIGPDNFRIRKGEYMEVRKGDQTILANNLYLETLSGSGILGLASLVWLVWEFGRRVAAGISDARCASALFESYFGVAFLAGFLSHGVVDYFLKFTPTFLLFWLVLGSLCARPREVQRSKDEDRL